MHWISSVVIEKTRFVRTFTFVMWVVLMIGAVLWLGVAKGLADTVHWVFLAGLTWLGAYCWSVFMWHFFVRPQLESVEREKQS